MTYSEVVYSAIAYFFIIVATFISGSYIISKFRTKETRTNRLFEGFLSPEERKLQTEFADEEI